MRRVAIVGAGYISAIHADALAALPGLELSAVVDRNRPAAERLAKRHRVASIFSDVQELIDSRVAQSAHVAVPPPLHRAVAEPLLQAGIDVLLEKPMAAHGSDAEALAALPGPGRLGVNQNFVCHPAFLKLVAALPKIGRIEHVHVLYNVPLRQLVARQFGHWMFAEPKNILLEQAVHPLSQVLALLGDALDVSATAGRPLPINEQHSFYPVWHVSLRCEKASADLQFAVGRDFPCWQVSVVGTDGVACADILNNRTVTQLRSRYPDFTDVAIGGLSMATQFAMQGAGSIARYGGSLLKLLPRNDPFFLSMKNSIAAFHFPGGSVPSLDGRFGAKLVTLCEKIAADVGAPGGAPATAAAQAARPATASDVAILGGTGFIGTHLVRALLREGKRLSILARGIDALPSEFRDSRVQMVRGDVHDPEAVARCIGSARHVVNLAQGAAGATESEIIESMVTGARLVAEACIARGVDRLVHFSTIAALYLGDASAAITAETPTDPKLPQRAVYARGKALAERAAMEVARGSPLAVVILRPGVVVGDGGLPFHSGVGFFNNEQHFMGWDDGRHPLPFVLVEDVARAAVQALAAPEAAGKTLNLIGDVRLTAREYVRLLGNAMERPLQFHGNAPWKLTVLEAAKWALKRAAGRSEAVRPTHWDIKSRGLSAPFDTSQEKRILGWKPVADHGAFVAAAIKPFAPKA